MSKSSNNNSVSGLSVSNIVMQCFISSIIGYVVYIVLSAVFTYISLKSDIVKKNLFFIEVFVIIISSIVCGYLCAGKLKIKGIVCGGFSAIFLMVLIYITLAVASSMTFTNKCLIVVPITFIFSIIGAIIYKNTRHRK